MGPNVTRAMLEAAPSRPWDQVKEYDSILLLPTKKKHDSGWHSICIVGVLGEAFEQAAWCDDVCWKHAQAPGDRYSLRTDMLYPSGICHIWGWDSKFIVGMSLSSTDITVRYTKP